jgi:hypothetical protein
MTNDQANQVIRVLATDGKVFGLEIDSLIRQAGNAMTAAALFRMLHAMDLDSADFPQKMTEFLREFGAHEPACLIGFDDGRWVDLPVTEEGEEMETPPEGEPVSRYLKIVHSSVDASFYLFHAASRLLDGTGISGGARKRENEVHHVEVRLTDPRQLQHILTRARECPHVIRVEESTAEEFRAAPSHNPGY